VTVNVTPGFLTPCFAEKSLRLGRSELDPTLRRTLLLLQSRDALSGRPEVDDFRHVNDWR